MSDYDKMSVEELIGVAADYRGMAVTMDRFIIPALRRAVIREAQVGEISIEQHEGYMSPDPMFTVGTKSKLVAGDYWLVKKDNP